MLLEVKNLSVDFKVGKQTLRAANNVSFSLGEKDSLGLVGESGCGKSTTAFALMRLLASNGKITEGQILLDGTTLPRHPTTTSARSVGRTSQSFSECHDRAESRSKDRRSDRGEGVRHRECSVCGEIEAERLHVS